LGGGFECTVIEQPDDYSGAVVSTVVRKQSADARGRGILYIHGFNDYFFQRDMADTLVSAGYSFYAVDLRKYGRSLRPWQKPYECRSISEYYPDIDSALCVMKADGVDRVVVMAHSTGGLVAACYLNALVADSVWNADIKALILNSPFLQWNMNGFMRHVAVPVVSSLGRIFPDMAISQGNSTAYAESLLADYHGQWSFNTDWKTVHPRKVTAGWIRAITMAQKSLRKHSDIPVPILLLHSDNSVNGDKFTETHMHGDAVLNVKDISQIGRTLGPDVEEITIAGGLHDLALSLPEPRALFYAVVLTFLRGLSCAN